MSNDTVKSIEATSLTENSFSRAGREGLTHPPPPSVLPSPSVAEDGGGVGKGLPFPLVFHPGGDDGEVVAVGEDGVLLLVGLGGGVGVATGEEGC